MKTIIAMILSVLMAVVPVMGETTTQEPAADIADIYMIEGIVAENSEEGILISTAEMGNVLVLTSDETILEGAEALVEGDYVYVDYNGMMTRSLPPQITAMVIRSYRLKGIVTEIFAEENAMLINTESHGDVYVNLPAADEATDESAEEAVEQAAVPQAGDAVTVYFNGAMTMSLPAQIGAGLVVIQNTEAV